MTSMVKITSEIELLLSKSNRQYIGCRISHRIVKPYLALLYNNYTCDYKILRARQIIRDKGKFHLTVISPPEYLSVATPTTAIGKSVQIELSGMGCADDGQNQSFFVVASCEYIHEMRRALGLSYRDLHITIGFNSSDLQNVSKGQATLL